MCREGLPAVTRSHESGAGPPDSASRVEVCTVTNQPSWLLRLLAMSLLPSSLFKLLSYCINRYSNQCIVPLLN